jgi:hypothetical protein
MSKAIYTVEFVSCTNEETASPGAVPLKECVMTEPSVTELQQQLKTKQLEYRKARRRVGVSRQTLLVMVRDINRLILRLDNLRRGRDD